MLKLVVALVLVIGSVQCAAACTPITSAQPPCHHHKQAPVCRHELIPATTVQTYVALEFSPEAVEVPAVIHSMGSLYAGQVQDPSPPGFVVPPLTVLRI
jgi:hypothetical protein